MLFFFCESWLARICLNPSDVRAQKKHGHRKAPTSRNRMQPDASHGCRRNCGPMTAVTKSEQLTEVEREGNGTDHSSLRVSDDWQVAMADISACGRTRRCCCHALLAVTATHMDSFRRNCGPSPCFCPSPCSCHFCPSCPCGLCFCPCRPSGICFCPFALLARTTYCSSPCQKTGTTDSKGQGSSDSSASRPRAGSSSAFSPSSRIVVCFLAQSRRDGGAYDGWRGPSSTFWRLVSAATAVFG